MSVPFCSRILIFAGITVLSSPIVLAQTAAGGSSVPVESPAQPGDDTTAETPPVLTESVIVTATRGSIDRATSPASSSLVTRQQIEQRAIVSVDQALAPVEGVYAYRVRGLADNESGVGMRGFSGRGSGQSRVLTLIDGQPINNGYTGAVNWTALNLGEVDRVEVVRGPFSSLYGGNAMGGVINILTRPIERRSAELYFQGGSNQTTTAYARGGMRLTPRFGLSVSYEDQRTGGYQNQEVLRPATVSTMAGGTPITGVTRYLTRTGDVNYAVGLRGDNWFERSGLRARGEYTFGAGSFGSVQYLRQATAYGHDPYTTSARAASGQLLDSGAVVFEENGQWQRLTLSPSNYLGPQGGGTAHLVQAQWLRSSSAGQWQVQGGLLDVPGERTGLPGAAATHQGGAGTLNRQTSRNFYATAQWSHDLGARHLLTVGTDLRQEQATLDVFPVTDFRARSSSSPRDTAAAGRARTMAVFAQDQITLSDRLGLTLGARFDRWQTYDASSQAGTSLPTEDFPSRGAGALTGKAALVYRATSSTAIRTSVGTSFRNPTVFDLYRDVRLSSGRLLLGNPELDPEHMVSWEAGIRQDIGTAVSVDAAYYENRIRDLVQRSVDLIGDPTGFTSRHFNAGRARMRGTELALTWRPRRWITARPTYTFTDATIVENDAAPTTVGKQVTFVPRHTAAGTVTAVTGKLTTTATGRYQSAVFATDTNTDTVRDVPGGYDSFAEIDLAATYALTRRVQLTASAENLLNRRYYLFYRNAGRLLYGGVRVNLR